MLRLLKSVMVCDIGGVQLLVKIRRRDVWRMRLAFLQTTFGSHILETAAHVVAVRAANIQSQKEGAAIVDTGIPPVIAVDELPVFFLRQGASKAFASQPKWKAETTSKDKGRSEAEDWIIMNSKLSNYRQSKGKLTSEKKAKSKPPLL